VILAAALLVGLLAYGVASRGRIAAQRRGPVDQKWLDRSLQPLLGETA
jgi:hypothetical protein